MWLSLFCAGMIGSAVMAVAQRRSEPWQNDVAVFRVDASGEAHQVSRFERAGVSSLARLPDGRVVAAYQAFPNGRTDPDFDRVAVRFSSDDGVSWDAATPIRLTGLPESLRSPFDPTLVTLPDGRVRLYFTSLEGRRFEDARPAIYSAVSANGIDYAVEPGVRFAVEGRPVIDCAVVIHRGRFHLFAPDNGEGPAPAHAEAALPPAGPGYHAISQDGLAFTRQPDVVLGGRRWLGGAHSDGTLMTFVGTSIGGALWTATSRDGQAWTANSGLNVPGADPGAVSRRDGGLLVSVTVPPSLAASPVR